MNFEDVSLKDMAILINFLTPLDDLIEKYETKLEEAKAKVIVYENLIEMFQMMKEEIEK